jgi:Ca2+-binding RTX toxin-like protein
MSLKHKTVHSNLPKLPSLESENLATSYRSPRRLGFIFVVVGTLLLLLSAGDALAGTGTGERLSGFGGADEIQGLSGNDFLSGGGGRDDLYGGPGQDLMLGGAGDDFIEAKDGNTDYIDCGSGRDTVSVDAEDRVSANCETIYSG